MGCGFDDVQERLGYYPPVLFCLPAGYRLAAHTQVLNSLCCSTEKLSNPFYTFTPYN